MCVFYMEHGVGLRCFSVGFMFDMVATLRGSADWDCDSSYNELASCEYVYAVWGFL